MKGRIIRDNRPPAAGDGSRGRVQIGLLVRSTRGRDRGRYYLVVGMESETKVRVADGDLRRVESPKRKTSGTSSPAA